jgi:hypothetical protein
MLGLQPFQHKPLAIALGFVQTVESCGGNLRVGSKYVGDILKRGGDFAGRRVVV